MTGMKRDAGLTNRSKMQTRNCIFGKTCLVQIHDTVHEILQYQQLFVNGFSDKRTVERLDRLGLESLRSIHQMLRS